MIAILGRAFVAWVLHSMGAPVWACMLYFALTLDVLGLQGGQEALARGIELIRGGGDEEYLDA
jgi:hypothetical protein